MDRTQPGEQAAEAFQERCSPEGNEYDVYHKWTKIGTEVEIQGGEKQELVLGPWVLY